MRHTTSSALLKTTAAMVILAGIALRVAGAWWYRNDPNPDYAIVVEMVRNMARGNVWPVFFYGQSYMGSLEPAASVVFAWLFGPSTFSVCLGTAFFGLLLMLAVGRWAADIAGPWAGVLAMAAAVLGPPAFFQYLGSPRGGYALGLLLIVVILREACRIAALESGVPPSERPCAGRRRYARLGFLAGIAFWNFWLVLPAVATAGLLLVAALRGRLLRRCVIAPGVGGFLLGSAPFWAYNAVHRGASFAPANGGAPGFGEMPTILRYLFLERLPKLLDLVLPAPWQLVYATALFLSVALCAVLLFPRRNRASEPRTWAMPAMAGFCALFGAAYLLSSFGRVHTPRYLLPAVPLLAVLAGVAPVLLWRAAHIPAAARARRLAAIAAAALGAFLVVGPRVAETLSLRHHWARSIHNEAWRRRGAAATDALQAHGVRSAIIDYTLWGINWAGDERIVFSSPHLERFRPYALALESDENPAVVENFHGFDHFLLATGGKATTLRVPGLRVAVDASPPAQAVSVLPDSVIADIRNTFGRSIVRTVTDQFATTTVGTLASPDEDRHLDIRLARPTTVCGIRLWSFNFRNKAWFAAEAKRPDGTYAALTPPCADSGFHWSGPCFFWEGLEHHFDLRFPPVETDALRLLVSSPRGESIVIVDDIDILAPAAPRPAPDPAAIAAELLARNICRVHAGRWLAARLRPLLPPSVWVSPLPNREEPDSAIQAATIVPDEGTAVLVDPGDAEPVRRGLSMMRAPMDETPLSGVTAFFFGPAPSESIASYRGAKFLGASVQHSLPSELASIYGTPAVPPPTFLAEYEDGDFGIVDIRATKSSVRPGDTVAVYVQWYFTKGAAPHHSLFQALHFLVDGKVAFQCDAPFRVELGDVDEDGHQLFVSHLSVEIPDKVSGEIVPAYCLYWPGLRSRRLAPDTELPTSRKRLLLDPIPCIPAP